MEEDGSGGGWLGGVVRGHLVVGQEGCIWEEGV